MSLFSKVENIINDTQFNAAITSILAQYGETLEVETISAGSKEVTTIVTVADVAGSLGGKYFLISANSVNYYV